MATRSLTYEPHSTHRIEALRGARFASFRARALAMALDFAIAALSFTPLAVLGLKALQGTGVLHPDHDIQVEFTYSSARWATAPRLWNSALGSCSTSSIRTGSAPTTASRRRS